MTGHIPGTTVLRTSHMDSPALTPGANHVGLRIGNERLLLSLIRAHGQLSKAQLAELSGLTTQTTSVISRSLVEAGLLTAGAPVRGKVGQPYVPISLNPDGAMFLGVHVDCNEANAALVNFTGGVIFERSAKLAKPDMESVLPFVQSTATRIKARSTPDQRARFQGIGLSLGHGFLGRDDSVSHWREIESSLQGLSASLDLAIYVSTDAISACSAELIYGLGSGVSDFLYVFIDGSVSGGLVQDGRIRFSRDDAGASLGKVLVPGADGRMVPLTTLAPGSTAQAPSTQSLELLSRGLAYAVTSAAAVVHYRTVILDGTISSVALQQITVKLRAALSQLNLVEAAELSIREGSRGRKTVALGAACLPLADRFYPSEGKFTNQIAPVLDRNGMARTGG